MYMEFRATLRFLKFQLALNPMYRIFLNFAEICKSDTGAYPYYRFYTKEPHFPGSTESYELAKDIQEKWNEYGIDVTMKKYIIMLSKPKKPGVVALYNGSQEVSRSAPQETFLIPSENNSLVITPFNAYAPSGSVKVSVNNSRIYISCPHVHVSVQFVPFSKKERLLSHFSIGWHWPDL